MFVGQFTCLEVKGFKWFVDDGMIGNLNCIPSMNGNLEVVTTSGNM